MSGPVKLLRRLADVNPVTLKEIRQLVRTRFILWAMLLYPLVLLLVSGCVLSSATASASRLSDPAARAFALLTVTAGPGLLGGALVPLGVLTSLAIPLMTGIRLTRETARARMDLQFTTALTAQDIVSGKIMGAFLLTLTFAALSLPFLTLAYLMRGIDLADIAWATLATVAMSLVSTTVAVTIGSLRLPVGLRVTLLAIGYVIGGFYVLIGAVVTVVDTHLFFVSRASLEPWAVAGLSALAVVALVAFGRAWAAANLMPDHTDGKRGLRHLELVLVAVTWAVALTGTALTGDDEWAIGTAWAFIALIGVACFALFQPTGVSRAVAAHAPRSLPGRIFSFPFATTMASGALFAGLLTAVSEGVLVGCFALSGDNVGRAFSITLSTFGEVLLVATLVAMAFRACKVRRGLYAVGPVIVFAVFGVLQLSGMLEAMDVVPDAEVLFGNFSGITSRPMDHAAYGFAGLCVFVPYVAVAVRRAFRLYRHPEAAAK